MKTIRPHHLILGLLAGRWRRPSGCRAWSPTITQQHDDSPVSREVFGNIPSAWKLRPLHAQRRHRSPTSASSSATGSATGSGARPTAGRTTTKNVKRRARRLPGRRLHADPAARSRRRDHAQPHLLLVPGALRRHHDPRDQPPGARGLEVPPRRRLPGLLGRRRRRRRSPSSSASCGRSSAATSSGPTGSASSPSPSTPSSSARSCVLGRLRASWPRPTASPSPTGPTSSSGRFVGYPLGQLVDGTGDLAGWHQIWWIAHVGCVLRLPRDAAGHDAAPHVHVAAEHVPARTGSARRAP